MRQELANRIRSVMDGQRLVSLDTLLALGDGLNEMAQGKQVADGLIPLAGELREFEMPRPMFTSQRAQRMGGRVLQHPPQFAADANRFDEDHQVARIRTKN